MPGNGLPAKFSRRHAVNIFAKDKMARRSTNATMRPKKLYALIGAGITTL
jgi:hypothetical protein